MPKKFLKIFETESDDFSPQEYWDEEMEESYFQNPSYYLAKMKNHPIYHFFQNYLPQEGLILDGGCGGNLLSLILSSEKRRIIGLDFAKQNLIEGKKKFPQLLSLCGDLNALPFANESFDAILSFSTAEHLETGPQKLFNESFRTLKKDGLFLMTIPTYQLEDMFLTGFSKFKSFFQKRESSLSTISHFKNTKLYHWEDKFYSEPSKRFFANWMPANLIKKLLKQSGFEIKKHFPIDLVSGGARSSFFSKFFKNQAQSLPLAGKTLSPSKLDFLEELLMYERFSPNYSRRYFAKLVLNFYHYQIAWVCKKPVP